MLNIAVELMVRRAPHNWFWVHDRWKTPLPDFLLAGYRRGIVLPKGYEAARLQTFELLVRSPNWLGDACMAFPAVRALKRGRPDLRLTVLCPAKLVELWQGVPEVDDVIPKEARDSIFAVAAKVRMNDAMPGTQVRLDVIPRPAIATDAVEQQNGRTTPASAVKEPSSVRSPSKAAHLVVHNGAM
jgi:hypothetical protein